MARHRCPSGTALSETGLPDSDPRKIDLSVPGPRAAAPMAPDRRAPMSPGFVAPQQRMPMRQGAPVAAPPNIDPRTGRPFVPAPWQYTPAVAQQAPRPPYVADRTFVAPPVPAVEAPVDEDYDSADDYYDDLADEEYYYDEELADEDYVDEDELIEPATTGRKHRRLSRRSRRRSTELDDDYDYTEDLEAAHGPTDAFVLGEVGLSTLAQTRKNKGVHRLPTPPIGARGRIVISAMAAGAFVAAGIGQYLTGQNSDSSLSTQASTTNAAFTNKSMNSSLANSTETPNGIGGDSGLAAPDVLLVARNSDPAAEARKLRSTQQAINQVAEAKARAKAEHDRPKFVRPAEGNYSSGFGPRWGTFHYGIDIANAQDTPIVAAADGVIVEAGPASGFGLWVRQQLPDGTMLVYGHMDDFSVHAGQQVKAGEQIARMGARGESTGVHLHFEVWDPSGKKIDPQPWLAEHGIRL